VQAVQSPGKSKLRLDVLKRPRVVSGALVGIFSLVLYSITLAPDILAHDSSEWQASAATLGISHPPGSPAYTLIGYLFTLVPVGNLAARVSFLSVVMGAAGVVAIYWFMLTLFDRLLPALVAALTLAVAAQWWGHASVATPYNVVPTIIALELTLLLLWRRKGDIRMVWVGALAFGLGIAYHPSLMFFLPVLIAGLFILGKWRELFKPKAAIITVLLFCAGLAIYAYLPIRSAMDSQIQYATATKIDSVASFMNYVSASDARSTGHGVIRMPDLDSLGNKLSEVVRQGFYPSYAYLVFGPAVILLYPAVWPALRRIRRELIFLLAAIAGHMFIVFAISGEICSVLHAAHPLFCHLGGVLCLADTRHVGCLPGRMALEIFTCGGNRNHIFRGSRRRTSKCLGFCKPS